MDLNLAKELDINFKDSKVDMNIVTMNGQNQILTHILNNVEIYNLNMTKMETVNTVFCKSKWPFSMSDSPSYNDIKDLEYLKEIPFNFINKHIGILVGVNMSEMLKPIEIVEGPSDQPFAVRYKFGWALLGNTCDGITTFSNL